jgi:hypothetical protein
MIDTITLIGFYDTAVNFTFVVLVVVAAADDCHKRDN